MNAHDDRFDDLPWEAAPGAEASDWELAAAACELALLAADRSPVVAAPAAVRERIVAAAAGHLPRRRSATAAPRPADGADGRSPFAMAGWWVAACLAAAVVWLAADAPRIAGPGAGEVAEAPAALRRRLLAEDPQAVTVAWKAGQDPSIAAGADLGDVVWSPSRQQGFMRIRGLAANDPTKEQYQLWIFDAERNADHPVDGGVFDVPADGDVVVPMDPRLPVGRATLFAVTVEKPGGVVVSTRERLPLLAAVP